MSNFKTDLVPTDFPSSAGFNVVNGMEFYSDTVKAVFEENSLVFKDFSSIFLCNSGYLFIHNEDFFRNKELKENFVTSLRKFAYK